MLHLRRQVWIQLGILAVVAAVSCGLMVFNYMRLPAEWFHVGRYRVVLELGSAGGLYQNSNVTYRGVQVGEVKDVRVTDTGVRAVLALNSDVPIPSDAKAEVHSRSAVGEQYVDLIPQSATSRPFRNGDVITEAHTRVPPDIAELLDATNAVIQAIPRDNLKTVIDEANTAVAGLGPELSRIVNGSTSLATEAGRATDPITRLIDDAGPVLQSQLDSADSIPVWADRLASITGQLRAQDTAVRNILQQGGPTLEEGRQLLDRVAPTLPIMLANLVSLGEIAVTYQPALEQLLVLVPQGIAIMSGTVVPNKDTKQAYRGAYLDFNLNLNLPQPCLTGYLPAAQRRGPSKIDYPDPPVGELYCRIPQDAQTGVRGARNLPCQTVAGKRAPTVAMCESGERYVPLNDGTSWKGDPNATLSGQDIPQLPPGVSRDAVPPAAPQPAPPPLAIAYDPATGTYVGPDGKTYTQSDLAPATTPQTWQGLLLPPTP